MVALSTILTPENKIETPSKIKDLTGLHADTYTAYGRVYLHFEDVQDTAELERVYKAVSGVTEKSAVTWMSYGGELVLEMPHSFFQRDFVGSQSLSPSRPEWSRGALDFLDEDFG